MFTCSDESRTVRGNNLGRRGRVKITAMKKEILAMGGRDVPGSPDWPVRKTIHSSSDCSKETTLENHLKMLSFRDLFCV